MADRLNILPFQRLIAILKANDFVFGVDTVLRLNQYWQLLAERKDLERSYVKHQLAALICRSAEDQELFYQIIDAYLIDPDTVEWQEGLSLPSEEQEIKPPEPPPTPEPKKNGTTTMPPPGKLPDYNTGPILPVLSFPENILRVWNLPQMSPALIPLKEKIWMDTTEWDIPSSIRRTIRAGGIPQIIYRKRKRTPRYLALIEQMGPRDHVAGLAAELVREINRRDLETDYYFYTSSPAKCWKNLPDRSTHLYLDRLKSEWTDARLLLIGDAANFIDPFTGQVSNVVLDIRDSWPQVALLSTSSPLSWGANEKTLARLFPVAPLSSKGLHSLIGQWNGTEERPVSYWKFHHPEPVPPDLNRSRSRQDNDILLDMFRYLGKEAFQWLCATTLYPEIYYELTAHLHDEAIPPQSDLSVWEQNRIWNQALRLISRLDWFRRGHIPERMRNKLKPLLPTGHLATLEREIRRILDWSYNAVPPGSYAAARRTEMFGWMSDKVFRILWIDDRPDRHEGFQRGLTQTSGVVFRNVRSFSQALPMLQEHFDLIISDVGRTSDNLDAFGTLREIQSREHASPLIFYTSGTGMNLKESLESSGAVEVTDDKERLQQLILQQVAEKFGIAYAANEPESEADEGADGGRLKALKEQVKQLIGRANTKQAIELLEQAIGRSSNRLNELILIQSRFNNLERNDRLGIINQDESAVERNQLTYQLLSLIDQLSVQDVAEESATTQSPETTTAYLVYQIPRTMQLQQSSTCTVRIGQDQEAMMDNLQTDQEDSIEMHDIRVSEIMEVQLAEPSGEQNFEISGVTDATQVLSEDSGFTQWLISVKPIQENKTPLLLKISTIETVNYEQHKRETVLELDTITILPAEPPWPRTITGTVLDRAYGEPLIGANVRLRNSETGTITDMDGRFSIQVPDEDSVLEFSYVGYKFEQRKVANTGHWEIEMEEDDRKQGFKQKKAY